MSQAEVAAKFPVGSRVKLKIASPTMIVKAIGTTGGYVECQWFAGKKLESGRFAPEALVSDEEDPAAPKQ